MFRQLLRRKNILRYVLAHCIVHCIVTTNTILHSHNPNYRAQSQLTDRHKCFNTLPLFEHHWHCFLVNLLTYREPQYITFNTITNINLQLHFFPFITWFTIVPCPRPRGLLSTLISQHAPMKFYMHNIVLDSLPAGHWVFL